MSDKVDPNIEIDGFRYEVGYIDPEAALGLFIDLFGTLAPALGSARAAAIMGEDGMLSAGLERLVQALDKGKMLSAMKVFAAQTKLVDLGTGKTVGVLSEKFNTHFRGKFGPQMEWFVHAVKVHYTDFMLSSFKDIGSLREALMGTTTEATEE